jgi:hypothetical protein
MNYESLASPAFTFSCSNRAQIRRAFLVHLARFERQFRDVSWETAPAAFARACGDSDAEAETTTRLFSAAMEELLDEGTIEVERLGDGSNRIVRVVREDDEVFTRPPTDGDVRSDIVSRGRSFGGCSNT